MPVYDATPMKAYAWAEPNIDLEDPRFVISVEWTWPLGDWTHFSLVRSVRSPVRRREEGQVVMECFANEWEHTVFYPSDEIYDPVDREIIVSDGTTRGPGVSRPVYRDPQPPPGEWVYYTAFVLDPNRVWTPAGYIHEIGIADYDWTLRLPELLPGVAIANRQQTVAPADQGNDLVQFFQSPGAFLDRAVTMAEAEQFFWNPLRCPPQMLEHQMRSLGYTFDPTLGTGRLRHVIDALMRPQQGSLPFVAGFVEGATGYWADVRISNNLMINTDDSSFESGSLDNTQWAGTETLEVRSYLNWLNPPPTVPPNVLISHFLYSTAAQTITCGLSDPVAHGIPCAVWDKARMGCYAWAENGGTTLSMGLKLYDYLGAYLTDVEILPAQTLTTQWAWYGNADTSAVDLTGISDFAYAVPYITVSDACSLDLIVVDDG